MFHLRNGRFITHMRNEKCVTGQRLVVVVVVMRGAVRVSLVSAVGCPRPRVPSTRQVLIAALACSGYDTEELISG